MVWYIYIYVCVIVVMKLFYAGLLNHEHEARGPDGRPGDALPHIRGGLASPQAGLGVAHPGSRRGERYGHAISQSVSQAVRQLVSQHLLDCILSSLRLWPVIHASYECTKYFT